MSHAVLQLGIMPVLKSNSLKGVEYIHLVWDGS
jgi:hypothetical protein